MSSSKRILNYRRLYDNFTLLLEDNDEKKKDTQKGKGKEKKKPHKKKMYTGVVFRSISKISGLYVHKIGNNLIDNNGELSNAFNGKESQRKKNII